MLVIAGHDPAGAGIQADIETAASLGCYAATLVTCLTTQNSRGVQAILPTPAAALLAQATCLLEDITAPVVCKLGLIPDLETLEVVLEIINCLLPAGTRVVVDPVLGATAGGPLSRPEMAAAIATRLLPVCTVATPNKREFSRLEQAACELGGATSTAAWTLITGADEPGNIIRHELQQGRRRYADYDWPRIDGIFHGSGCTLATAVAAFLATRCGGNRGARRWGLIACGLVTCQLALGVGTWIAKYGVPSAILPDAWRMAEPIVARSGPGAVIVTSHAVLGMMILGVGVALALTAAGTVPASVRSGAQPAAFARGRGVTA